MYVRLLHILHHVLSRHSRVYKPGFPLTMALYESPYASTVAIGVDQTREYAVSGRVSPAIG